MGLIWSNLILTMNHKRIEIIGIRITTNEIQEYLITIAKTNLRSKINRIGVTLLLHHLNNNITNPILDHHKIKKVFD